jgi:hypothetical protein
MTLLKTHCSRKNFFFRILIRFQEIARMHDFKPFTPNPPAYEHLNNFFFLDFLILQNHHWLKTCNYYSNNVFTLISGSNYIQAQHSMSKAEILEFRQKMMSFCYNDVLKMSREDTTVSWCYILITLCLIYYSKVILFENTLDWHQRITVQHCAATG